MELLFNWGDPVTVFKQEIHTTHLTSVRAFNAYTCPDCHSVVTQDSLFAHESWHRTLTTQDLED